MDAAVAKLWDLKLNRVKEALIQNNMDARIVNTKEEVCAEIEKMIEKGASVNVGGSQSLFDCGVIDLLRKMDVEFHDRHNPDNTRDDLTRIYKQAFSDDYYLCSCNAITLNGELYNVDGRSNRVAAITYGPEHVILIVGKNKIVADLKEAEMRVKQIAAPANCMRLQRNTPCVYKGECKDCNSEDRICCTVTIHKKQMVKNRISVILVKEDLGF